MQSLTFHQTCSTELGDCKVPKECTYILHVLPLTP